ncbi:right-handed parallel beta-helix repeat-containing protein [Rossellomorea vietnamensis]|uniref:right-handed parallel beta-helix repeat-containing protein n=1 Tax=Rossellomorea vietnamensis TaxID=218284 RepID=UPI001E313C02|nr:NosD domain-containing protein [Rossellomorea vietnamensis]MCC5800802.1 right-handed parallel beta-helix repeat-containing protein [Rossellomorea vietnamensis]
MKVPYVCLVALLCTLVLSPHAKGEKPSLQSIIDDAEAGGEIVIPSGYYTENIVISKPLTLIGGKNVTIHSCEETPVVTIEGSRVNIRNLTIEQCSEESEGPPAIYVTGTTHRLEDLAVDTTQIGIQLSEADRVNILKSSITGRINGNGIDLWTSNDNVMAKLSLKDTIDGIYMEQSDGNEVSDSKMENARYGVHLMFSNDTVIRRNISHHNFTGAMVMKAKQTVISRNIFAENNQNVNSQGLLLYEADDTKVSFNEFDSNRVGAFIEKSGGSFFKENIFQSNMIGVQMKESRENTITHNDFSGNVNDVHEVDSKENTLSQNYWDASLKLDVNGDQYSEIPYKADPYFLTLTEKVPEYQLFFQNPGLNLVKQVFNSPAATVLSDTKPTMVPKHINNPNKNKKQIPLWVIGSVFLILNLLIIQKWRNVK